jgi:hypothetical protein
MTELYAEVGRTLSRRRQVHPSRPAELTVYNFVRPPGADP